MAAASDPSEERVSVDMDVSDGRTTITVSGDPDAAVVVWSESGERVYLPPEEAVGEKDPSPYQGQEESPYTGTEANSPYQSAREVPASLGLNATANGFRIVHPEPVTDFRILR